MNEKNYILTCLILRFSSHGIKTPSFPMTICTKFSNL